MEYERREECECEFLVLIRKCTPEGFAGILFSFSFSNLIGKRIIDMHDMQTPSTHSINLCMRKYFYKVQHIIQTK